MVKLHVKRDDESLFLYATTTDVSLANLLRELTSIYNGRLKIYRICEEIDELVKSEDVVASSSSKRKLPSYKMVEVLTRASAEARSSISVESVSADICLTMDRIHDALDVLRVAVNVAYPDGLLTDDAIRRELENRENIEGTTAEKDVIHFDSAQLWWAGKELQTDKKLLDFVGRNEKTKIIVKLQKKGHGPPTREPAMTEEQKKQLMLETHRRQQELQRLEDDKDDNYLNSRWADQQNMKKTFHGVQNIQWKPR